VACVENHTRIQDQLDDLGLTAFVADEAILPRHTGATDAPLDHERAVAFQSPESLRVTITIPNPIDKPDGICNTLSGMGIPKGVTLVVGGGYHGKSTLLQALERGVYPHIPDDGREYVVTCRDAVKIRAEDGRRVERVDISPFISNLPFGRSTDAFCSEDASGSTSQAANIVEAVEVGARVLLLDEDTSATNFMVRDARMQALVHKEHEPITP
ncbi:MAG: ATPase, partial [bacterium]|nr:ATPase [bacterium]